MALISFKGPFQSTHNAHHHTSPLGLLNVSSTYSW